MFGIGEIRRFYVNYGMMQECEQAKGLFHGCEAPISGWTRDKTFQ